MYRKTLGGTRSHRGSRAYGCLHSIFYTTRLRKKNPINEVQDMIRQKNPNPG